MLPAAELMSRTAWLCPDRCDGRFSVDIRITAEGAEGFGAYPSRFRCVSG